MQPNDFNSALREDAIDIRLSPGEVAQAPSQPTDFIFDFARDDILQFQRIGDDLVIVLNDGSSVRIKGYYVNNYENALVFSDSIEADGVSPFVLVGGALLGVSGLAMAGGGGSNNDSKSTIIINNGSGGDDGVINYDERDNGITLSGTATPGSIVSVTIGDVTHETEANENGYWEVVFESDEIPGDEREVRVQVSAIDPGGNVDEATGSITVDTVVNKLTVDDIPGGDDEIVNLSEAGLGLTIAGSVEPGSTVVVQFDGRNYTATVDAIGYWTASIPAEFVPASNGGEFLFSATATDAAGNILTVTESFHVDTQAPDAPIVETIIQTTSGVAGVSAATVSEGTVAFSKVDNMGNIRNVTVEEETETASTSITDYLFSSIIPEGSDAILSVMDIAGNIRSTYQAFGNGVSGSDVSVDHSVLGEFNIDQINLFFADEARLDLTEEIIATLSSETDTLTVWGGSDDLVSLAGATQNSNVITNGESFYAYSLGDTTVWVDEVIQVVL